LETYLRSYRSQINKVIDQKCLLLHTVSETENSF